MLNLYLANLWYLCKRFVHEIYAYDSPVHCRGPSGLSEVLAASDYVCSVLPSTPATKGLLSGDVLAVCKDKVSIMIHSRRLGMMHECSPGELPSSAAFMHRDN